jgi:hypothetical protein
MLSLLRSQIVILTRHVLVDCGATLDTPARDGGHGPLLAVSAFGVSLPFFSPDSGAKRMDDIICINSQPSRIIQ